MRVYGPRLSHISTYTEAYTPKRTKYNSCLVGILFGTAFAYEVLNKMSFNILVIQFTFSQGTEQRRNAREETFVIVIFVI